MVGVYCDVTIVFLKFTFTGYTFHQGSFLYVTKSGDVVLDKVVIGNSISKGERRLSRTRLNISSQMRQRQGAWEMSRDVVGKI